MVVAAMSACAKSPAPPSAEAPPAAPPKVIHLWSIDGEGGQCQAYDVSACPAFEKFVDPPCGGHLAAVGAIACPAWLPDGENAFVEQVEGARTCQITAADLNCDAACRKAAIGTIACPPMRDR